MYWVSRRVGNSRLVSTIRASTTVSRSSSTIPGRATPTPSRWERSTWFSSRKRSSSPAILRKYSSESEKSQMMEVWPSRLARRSMQTMWMWYTEIMMPTAQRTPAAMPMARGFRPPVELKVPWVSSRPHSCNSFRFWPTVGRLREREWAISCLVTGV